MSIKVCENNLKIHTNSNLKILNARNNEYDIAKVIKYNKNWGV